MRTQLVTIATDDSAENGLRTVAQHQIRQPPVVDGHTVVGTLTQTDIARSLPSDAVSRPFADGSPAEGH